MAAYSSKFAEYYDAIYGFKNYEAETDRLHELISARRKSSGNTLLDVACGTGGHIRFLRNRYGIEGLDQSEDMLAVARHHFPEIVFHSGDMRDFDLGRKFDVVVCLFSAIGYVKTPAGLRTAIANMSRHLLPGGVLAVEPWLSRETTRAGGVWALFVNQPNLKIARMDIPAVRDGVSVITFHCLVGTPERIEYFTETHELSLFSHEEYLEAFSAAGLETFYDERGLMDRGLYIGRSSTS